MANLLTAFSVLQSQHGCCDSITILVKHDLFKPVIRIRKIQLQTLLDMNRCLGDQMQRPEVQKICVDFFEQLGEQHIASRIAGFPSVHFMNLDLTCLHLCSLILQVASLSMVTYIQSHSREFYSPWLSRPIESFKLRGCDPNGLSMRVERLDLACAGKMTGGKVWTFRSNDSPQRSGKPVREGHWLLADVSLLLDTWGGSIVKAGTGSDGIKIFLEAGNGQVVPRRADIASTPSLTCHWVPNSEVNWWEPRTNDAIEFDKELLIGATTVNPNCKLYSRNVQQTLSGLLFDLKTRPPSWKLEEIEGSLSAGQYGTGNIKFVFRKEYGLSIKQSILDNWSCRRSLLVLNEPWGLEYSLCTGIARRVPIKNLLHGEVAKYILANLPDSWKVVEDEVKRLIQDIPRMSQEDWAQTAATLTGITKETLENVTELLLLAMEFTEVIEDGKGITLWWPEPELSLSRCRGLKIPFPKSSPASWLHMLKSSRCCAVFGVVTRDCLEYSGLRSCNSTNPDHGLQSIRTIMLDTFLCPTDCLASPTWSMQEGEKYGLWDGSGVLRVEKIYSNQNRIIQLRYERKNFPDVVRRLVLRMQAVREQQAVRDPGQGVIIL